MATPIAAWAFLPVFFRQHSPSAYAYLQNRFGLATRLLASAAFTVQVIVLEHIRLGKLGDDQCNCTETQVHIF